MAIGFLSAASDTPETEVSSVTWDHTKTAGASRYLIVHVAYGGGGVDSVTYGGQTLTAIGTEVTNGGHAAQMFYLAEAGVAAATGSPPAVTVNFTGTGEFVCCHSSLYSGVDSISSVGTNTGNSTTSTVDVTSMASDSWGVAVTKNARAATYTAGTNDTITGQSEIESDSGVALYTDTVAAGSATISCSRTGPNRAFAMQGAELVAAVLAKTADGDADMASPTASGLATLKPIADGTPSTTVATASGAATIFKRATSAATMTAIVAAGVAGIVKDASGDATMESPTASGVVTQFKRANGTPNMDSPTASGVVTIIKRGSGTPSTDLITASGVASLGVLPASGDPNMASPTASGVVTQIKRASAAGDSSGITFFWTCESTTFDADDYSVGDDTPTVTASASISSTQARAGTNSVKVPLVGSYYWFTEADDIGVVAEGSIGFSVYGTADLADLQGIWCGLFDGDTPNTRIRVSMPTADGNVAFDIGENGEGNTQVITTGAPVSAGAWFGIVFRWHESNQDMRLEVYNAAGTLVDSAENLSVGATSWPTDTPIDRLFVGDIGGADNADFYVDNVFASSNYNEPLQDFLGIASISEYGTGVVATPITASGVATILAKDASGTPSMESPTASGVARFAHDCTGTPSLDPITATGVATLGALTASGNPTLAPIVVGGEGNSDDFTNTNGTALATHDSNWGSMGGVGTSNDYPVGNFEIQSNVSQATAAFTKAGAIYTASQDVDFCEVEVQPADYLNNSVAVCIQATSTRQGYNARLTSLSGDTFAAINLQEDNGTSDTFRDTATISWDRTGSPIKIRIEYIGGNVVVTVDDVEEISWAEATPLTGGYPGFRLESNVDDLGGFDNWTDGGAGIARAIQIYKPSGTPSLDVITAAGVATLGALDANGTPSMGVITASGIARFAHDADGTPSLDVITASGVATLGALPASGDVTLDPITASGTARFAHDADGAPTLDAITASGIARFAHDASGTPTMDAITASGVASLSGLVTASGDPLLGVITASGAVTQTQLASGTPAMASPSASGLVNLFGGTEGTPTLEVITASGVATLGARTASGNPSIDPITATGVAGLLHDASGTPTMDAITASGIAALEGQLTATGAPSTALITAAGVVKQIQLASGTPSLDPITAVGIAIKEALSASGTPSIASPTAVGVVNLAPKVWLNTTQTISGATEMTVTAWNLAGTSITFTDPSGPPIGSLYLGVENRNLGGGDSNTGWIAVTVVASRQASGTPTMEAVTAAGTATLVGLVTASGTPTLDTITATGNVTQTQLASGAPSLDVITASGVATLGALPASGAPSLDAITASGVARFAHDVSGTPSTDVITASGVASLEGLVTATGSPSLEVITASGQVTQRQLASGTPTLDVITASGTVDKQGLVTASGTPAVEVIAASGQITQTQLLSGAPSLEAATAAGTARIVKAAQGTPSIEVIEASGVADLLALPAFGTPALDAITASGIAGFRSTASGTPVLDLITTLGVVVRTLEASGTPTLDVITAAGLVDIPTFFEAHIEFECATYTIDIAMMAYTIDIDLTTEGKYTITVDAPLHPWVDGPNESAFSAGFTKGFL